ncbi:universal stress protein [Desulfosarcina ovata]|uniref:Universal stress protein n=2 Tax=Desulfosarcina ovata TaxID=83564 RepID=A0A5K8AHJ5_9BACT|nr:universal stress protein [Desulfosarcina ovata]BBO85245.1 universal stress protein [Desulfosarcina ovata subsp. sediminis]BBO92137.1 universal stress protein [Desulfosarcina ovata subsp. ovata]
MTVNQIVYCSDFSAHAEAAFQTALDLAGRYRAKLYVIHVLPPAVNPMLTEADLILPERPDENLVVSINERMQEVYGQRIPDGMDCELVVRDGHVSTEIIRFIEETDADLAVVGAFGLSGMGLVLFGSVAKRIAHKAPCSVMIVRSKTA